MSAASREEKVARRRGRETGAAQDPALASSREEEKPSLLSLRPRTLAEYVGQEAVVENLRIALAAAAKRGEPLDHVLFHGPPGLGKTTLAHIISVEMGFKIFSTSGPALEKPKDLVGILSNLEVGDILFIDEVHRLSHSVEEFLYSAMEDFHIHFVLDKGAFARTIRMPIKPFTLVGATTRAGLLTPPLRERFGLFYHLDFYSEEELGRVVRRSAALLGVPLDEESAGEIARRSRGTPRIANRLLRRVRDFAEVMGDGRVTLALAQAALEREGVDSRGLGPLDRQYLLTIIETYHGGPVGIEALAATLNEEVDTLVDLVEPYLLKMGFLARTPGGRKAGDAAVSHLGSGRGQAQQRLL